MKYRNISVPFVGNRDIQKQADLFRNKTWGNAVPVKIEEIIEIKLKIKVIPIPSLLKLCSVDSQITSDFSSILVDNDCYINSETGRISFSLAHELGHSVLHKNLFESFKITSLEDVILFVRNVPERQYFYLESQANKFASYFLIPRDKLSGIRKNIVAKHKLEKIEAKTANSYIANDIARLFQVSYQAAENALNDLNNDFRSN